jgi:dimeric dUTPase (all-alpha-NTP-PPase superfamily)
MLDRLFAMQRDLNDRIFKKHDLGVISSDFDSPSFDPVARQKWILNYLRALVHEAVEAEDACAWKWWAKDKSIDAQALKVEIVDVWHFLISATIAAGMSPYELVAVYEQKWRVNHARQERDDYGRATKDAADAECRMIKTGL